MDVERSKTQGRWRYDFADRLTGVLDGDGEEVWIKFRLVKQDGGVGLEVAEVLHRVNPGTTYRALPQRDVDAAVRWFSEPSRLLTLASMMKAAARPDGQAPMRLPAIPPTGKKPNHFYEQLAVYVVQCQEHGIPVGPRLAEDNGVPTTTVHRWVREGRRRGIVPEASSVQR